MDGTEIISDTPSHDSVTDPSVPREPVWKVDSDHLKSADDVETPNEPRTNRPLLPRNWQYQSDVGAPPEATTMPAVSTSPTVMVEPLTDAQPLFIVPLARSTLDWSYISQ